MFIDPNTKAQKEVNVYTWTGHGCKEEAKNYVGALATNMTDKYPTQKPIRPQVTIYNCVD